jgi:hypothetical protein
LATKNVLPKYGFPVDVVELQTRYVPTAGAERLDLTRDLRVALSEYAPGSQLVAGGRVWTGGGLNLRPIRQASNDGRIWDQFGYAVCPTCMRFNELHLADVPPESCKQCQTSLSSGFQGMRGIYVKPEFGFIASPEEPKQSGEGRPRRLYSSRVFFADFNEAGEDAQPLDLSPTDAPYRITFARGGRLAVVNAGAAGSGFRVCESCGYGEAAPISPVRKGAGKRGQHRNPRTSRACHGTLRNIHLGHTFETDVLAIGLPSGSGVDLADGLSLLYSLLEGATEALGISRDDLDGVVRGTATAPEVVIFDNVPGGAGHARRIGEEFPKVVRSAYKRVAACECGAETSCYECLRGYSNQVYHEELSRLKALRLLELLVIAGGQAPNVIGGDRIEVDLQTSVH